MQLSEIFLGQGEDSFARMIRGVSVGKLKTYQLFDRLKARAHTSKLNSETLRKKSDYFWERLTEKDDELAQDLAQAILVSNLEMIVAVLDSLGIPHEEGFFAKDIDPATYLTDGWQQRVYDQFRERFSEPVVLFYINHLGWELGKSEEMFAPTAQA